jgi:NTE family protein
VLDRLLEDETLRFEGVSGTSAGALNAAVLATGMAQGGRAGAQSALRAFWLDVSEGGGCFGAAPGAFPFAGKQRPALPLLPTLPLGLAAYNLDWNPFFLWSQQFLQTFSPYQFNPLNLDPLRKVVERHVQTQALRDGPLALFITATAVQSGQPRIFDRHDLSIDALLASACLPSLFRAVMIAGAGGGPPEPYWDGGYTGNPALWPLVYNTEPLDILLVQINPRWREGTPDTRLEIDDRLAEITFNAALGGELRAIAFVQKLFAERRIDVGAYKNLRLHGIFGDTALAGLHASSKLNTDWDFLQRLHTLGRNTADTWWQENRHKLGREATLDVRESFLAPAAPPAPGAPGAPPETLVPPR